MRKGVVSRFGFDSALLARYSCDTMRPEEPSEPVLTSRLRLGFGMLAFGLGLMFFSGKVLPNPLPAGIAGGIALGICGLVVVIVDALREPPEGSAQSR